MYNKSYLGLVLACRSNINLDYDGLSPSETKLYLVEVFVIE